jgi:hypothetical protein
LLVDSAALAEPGEAAAVVAAAVLRLQLSRLLLHPKHPVLLLLVDPTVFR